MEVGDYFFPEILVLFSFSMALSVMEDIETLRKTNRPTEQ
jgi:hypothetical protein